MPCNLWSFKVIFMSSDPRSLIYTNCTSISMHFGQLYVNFPASPKPSLFSPSLNSGSFVRLIFFRISTAPIWLLQYISMSLCGNGQIYRALPLPLLLLPPHQEVHSFRVDRGWAIARQTAGLTREGGGGKNIICNVCKARKMGSHQSGRLLSLSLPLCFFSPGRYVYFPPVQRTSRPNLSWFKILQIHFYAILKSRSTDFEAQQL